MNFRHVHRRRLQRLVGRRTPGQQDKNDDARLLFALSIWHWSVPFLHVQIRAKGPKPMARLTYSWKWIVLLLVGLVLLASVGWTRGWFLRGYRDETKDIIAHARPLAIPPHDYYEVEWLTDKRIALLYASHEGLPSWNDKIMLYDLEHQQSRFAPLPARPECRLVVTPKIERVPNGNLGFVYQCLIDRPHFSDDLYSLYVWDIEVHTVQEVERYPDNFRPGQFAFAPNMSQLIQEQRSGLAEKVFLIRRDEAMEQLYGSWTRVRAPAWSRDGRNIAFVGTEEYTPPAVLHPLFGFGSMVDILYEPWTLYTAEVDGGEPQVMLEGIVGARLGEWSPDGELLTFTGEYRGVEGVWVVNRETKQVVRIWPYVTGHAWSPDGQQMLFIERRIDETPVHHRVVVVDLASRLGGYAATANGQQPLSLGQ